MPKLITTEQYQSEIIDRFCQGKCYLITMKYKSKNNAIRMEDILHFGISNGLEIDSLNDKSSIYFFCVFTNEEIFESTYLSSELTYRVELHYLDKVSRCGDTYCVFYDKKELYNFFDGNDFDVDEDDIDDYNHIINHLNKEIGGLYILLFDNKGIVAGKSRNIEKRIKSYRVHYPGAFYVMKYGAIDLCSYGPVGTYAYGFFINAGSDGFAEPYKLTYNDEKHLHCLLRESNALIHIGGERYIVKEEVYNENIKLHSYMGLFMHTIFYAIIKGLDGPKQWATLNPPTCE